MIQFLIARKNGSIMLQEKDPEGMEEKGNEQEFQ